VGGKRTPAEGRIRKLGPVGLPKKKKSGLKVLKHNPTPTAKGERIFKEDATSLDRWEEGGGGAGKESIKAASRSRKN